MHCGRGSLRDFSSASCSAHCYPRIPAALRFLPSPTPPACSTPICTTIERFFAAATGQYGKTDALSANALSSPRVAGRTQPLIHAGGEKSPPAYGRTGVSPLHALHSSPLDTPRQHACVSPRRRSKPPTMPPAATPSHPHSDLAAAARTPMPTGGNPAM